MTNDELREAIEKCLPDISAEINAYEMRGDNGDYKPTEDEEFLMTDFATRLLEGITETLTQAIRSHILVTGKKEE